MVKTCEALKEKILHKAAKYLETGAEELEFDGKRVYKLACEADGTRKEITIKDLANRVQCANEAVSYTHLGRASRGCEKIRSGCSGAL